MKFLKYPMFVFLVISSVMAYSQNLKPRDIDIFVGNFGTIMEIIDTAEMPGDFHSLGDAVVGKFQKIWASDDLSEEEVVELIAQYNKFLDYKMPGEIETAFNEAGWETSGFRNYFTIFLGTACIFIMEQMEDVENGFAEGDMEATRLTILRIFGEHDLNIITERMEELLAVVSN